MTTKPKLDVKAKIGFVMSVLSVLPFVPSALMKFAGSPQWWKAGITLAGPEHGHPHCHH